MLVRSKRRREMMQLGTSQLETSVSLSRNHNKTPDQIFDIEQCKKYDDHIKDIYEITYFPLEMAQK